VNRHVAGVDSYGQMFKIKNALSIDFVESGKKTLDLARIDDEMKLYR
jgi:hypothetical protein